MNGHGSALDTLFLRDVDHGGPPDQLATVAAALAEFVAAATGSLDVAIYDFRLSDEQAAGTVVGALVDAATRGVAVRIGYDAGKPEAQTAEAFAVVGADPAPVGTQEWVTEHFADTPVQVQAIRSAPQLMHSKYVVRDAPTADAPATATAAVWTGSTNFTDDAWTLQENNVLTVADPDVAAGYGADFQQLWSTGAIAHTGAGLAGTATVESATVGWDFSPGDGPALDVGLAGRVRSATSRIVVAAMVLTSHDVLAALVDAATRGVPLRGVYDGGQMDPIVRQWRQSGNRTVLENWTAVAAHLVRKNSTPYTPAGPHDFMHLKVLVTDDTVTTGSYNFSANAERNAENQIQLDHPETVAAYLGYLDAVTTEYA